jgi:hypothetical protein
MKRLPKTPRVLAGATLLSALLLTAACGMQPVVTRTETVEVKVPVKQAVPAPLLVPTAAPVLPSPLTNGGLRDYASDLLDALKTCNDDKASVSALVIKE